MALMLQKNYVRKRKTAYCFCNQGTEIYDFVVMMWLFIIL